MNFSKKKNSKEYGSFPVQQASNTELWYDRSNQFPQSSNSGDPRFDAKISNLLATNVLELAHEMSKKVLEESHEKTEVFSPLSIYGALSLLLLGSNGNTFTELLRLMRFPAGLYKHDLFLVNLL